MKVSSKELEAKKVKVVVDKNPVATSFEKWAQPGHFSRTLAKGPKTTTWIWNLHADAHDFDSQTNSLEDISRKIFSAHFGQLSLIFLWISGMYFHGARFSNYSAWLSSPTTVKQSSQVVWPVVGTGNFKRRRWRRILRCYYNIRLVRNVACFRYY
jgi:photosystem I P700 chlorophyll a apoprotein A1